MLYDPNFDFPRAYVPTCFEQYKIYLPENQRIVEYNKVSGSVRTKRTPESLQGKMVQYRDRGPLLIESKRRRRTSTEVKAAEAKLNARRVVATSSDVEGSADSGTDDGDMADVGEDVVVNGRG